MSDYSNLTRLGILTVDPGSTIYGKPSPNAYKPLPYPPLEEPLQKPDFSLITGGVKGDTFAPKGKNKDANQLNPEKKQRNFNWKKFVGITSIALLALFGLPKLIKKVPELIKKVPDALKKIPELFKKIPNLFKKAA